MLQVNNLDGFGSRPVVSAAPPPTGLGTWDLTARSAEITITSSFAVAAGDFQNWLDANKATGWYKSIAVSGEDIQFDFGVGASVKLTGATMSLESDSSHGTWKWQGSDNATSWTDVGGNFDFIVDDYFGVSSPPHGILSGVENNHTFINGNPAVSGLVFGFDFMEEKVVTECTYIHGGTAQQGTWKWQGSNDNISYTDIGSSFVLGGATTNILDELNGNTTAYRYYRMLGVSGSVTTSGYYKKFEFEIGGSYATGDQRANIFMFGSFASFYQSKAGVLDESMSANTTGYRYYRMLGDSGSLAVVWQRDIFFRSL